jgi:hypothetical protein
VGGVLEGGGCAVDRLGADENAVMMQMNVPNSVLKNLDGQH